MDQYSFFTVSSPSWRHLLSPLLATIAGVLDVVADVDEVADRVVDVNGGAEDGKDLLREPGDVADEGAEIGGHHGEQEDAHPDADP